MREGAEGQEGARGAGEEGRGGSYFFEGWEGGTGGAWRVLVVCSWLCSSGGEEGNKGRTKRVLWAWKSEREESRVRSHCLSTSFLRTVPPHPLLTPSTSS